MSDSSDPGHRTSHRHTLCRFADIPDGRARGFVLGSGGDALSVVAVRRGDAVFGYVNSCPHVGTPLDWTPDRFMSLDGRHLQCATHGALFRVEDGGCVAGPCAGKHLTPVELVLDDDTVVLLGR